MNLKTYALLTSLFLFGIMTAGCAGAGSDKQTEADRPVAAEFVKGTALPVSLTDPRVADMKGVAANNRLQLFADDQSGVIAVLDKNSGEVWYSNPPKRESDKLATGINKDLLSAQLKIDFHNAFGQLSSVNSYTDSVIHKQVRFESIPNGIRVTYQFGTDEKTADDIPIKLTKARLEELKGKVDKTGQRALTIAYKEDTDPSVYVRNDSLAGIQLKRTLQAFEDAGYTDEDFRKDLEALQLEQTKPEPRIFRASIEYTLDGDSLVVKVPASGIHYPDEYPINTISVLSYFGAEGEETEGSLFVPDGSGALIHFNNGKINYSSYKQRIYGSDLTMESAEDGLWEEKARLPVFGMIRREGAFLGIIEEGDSVASVNAEVSGKLNGYNYVYPSFYVINKDQVTLDANGQERSLPRFQENPTKSDFTIRYAFLSGEEATYSGMAQYYRQYLVKTHGLPEPKSASESTNSGGDAPFYLQLIGSISKNKHMAGIPYKALEPLTTFKQAENIVNQVQKRNIRNIKLQYSGWFNKGLDHQVPDHVSVDGAVGGSKALREFISFALDKGLSFFPDVYIAEARISDGFDVTKEASRTLKGDPAAIYPIEPVLNQRDNTKAPSYVVSPRYLMKIVDSMLNELDGYRLEGISLRDLGNRLNSDYRANHQIDRTESESISNQALTRIRERNLKIMANGGNAYAFPYVTDITNAPMTNSGFKIEDEAIPFYQMVVRGYIDYTGTPYNLSTFNDMNQYILKCLEYGSGIYFKWIHEPNDSVKDSDYDDLYAVNYEQWLDQAAQIYGNVNEVLGKVHNQKMISHEKLSDGVFKTVYENGIYVIVNYNRSRLQADGMNVEAGGYVMGGVQK
ncbi:DUF5696 domain-containing protein [Paenibacillus caseinilyticus]|uniref:Uncharacterized protein n=1 Tax=Paenibacillus mucilaginosus K02 TaxID=997761 RepID=I0BKA6_9BACL|nr:DUF5696 domain-containing protein [Paenibacillus mucilaginosus]AFH62803.1 hypothetical protein B2K_19130 [Paenibacillus mucilaginosus K02]